MNIFGVSQREYNRVMQRCSDLSKDVERLEKAIAQDSEEKTVARQRDVATATFSCDFKTMNAFAIERNCHNGNVCTIIGYFDKENKIKEWYLYCSQDQHEKLVKDFNYYKTNQ